MDKYTRYYYKKEGMIFHYLRNVHYFPFSSSRSICSFPKSTIKEIWANELYMNKNDVKFL